MKALTIILISSLLLCVLLAALPASQEEGMDLKHFTPGNYRYIQAEGCANCKGPENAFMPRAVGVDISTGKAVLDPRGWMKSTHSRSQSHGDRVNTACAFCHAPSTPEATRDKENARPIPRGTWQGVSCFACHPAAVDRDKRESLLSNFKPGTDPANPDNYIFRDRSDGKDMNTQCQS